MPSDTLQRPSSRGARVLHAAEGAWWLREDTLETSEVTAQVASFFRLIHGRNPKQFVPGYPSSGFSSV